MQPLSLVLASLLASGSVHEYWGVSIAPTNDVNGDGIRELWIGAPRGFDAIAPGAGGSVWLVCGSTGKALLEIPSPRYANQFGWTLASIQDIDADGHDDLAVSAQFLGSEEQLVRYRSEHSRAPQGEGCVYVFSGASGEQLNAWRGPADSLKVMWYSSGAGPTLAAIGDWDGDCREDLAVGWCYATKNEPEQGCVRVVSTGNGALLYEFWGEDAHDRFGYALTRLGNSDVIDAHALAASALPNRATADEGAHENLTFERPGYVRTFSPSGERLFEARSPEACPQFGRSLAWIPSSPGSPPRLAVSENHFCGHGNPIHLLDATTAEPISVIRAPTFREWRGQTRSTNVPEFEDMVGRSFGSVVVPLRDLDNDGILDLLVTEPQSFCDHPAAAISAASGEVLMPIALNENRRSGSCSSDSTHVGIAASTAGDYDKDGFDDFLLAGNSIRCGGCGGFVGLYSGLSGSLLRCFTRSQL